LRFIGILLTRAVLLPGLFFALFLGSLEAAGVQQRSVDGAGFGTSLHAAIKGALEDAVGRINGLSIETSSQLESVEVAAVDENDEHYFASESYKQSIKTATNGIISSYEVTSQQRSDSGVWEATVRAKVVVYIAPPRSNRKRMAVMPFRTSGGPFTVFGQRVAPETASRLLGQSLQSQLVQSRRFTVLNRGYMSETLQEKGKIKMGKVPIEELARLGQDLIADFIIAGTIETLSVETAEIHMQTVDRTIHRRSGAIEVGYNVIDVTTGQVAFADLLKLPVGDAELSSFGSGDPASSLCDLAGERISRRILEAIYPILVVSVSGDTITMGQGGDGIKVGDRYEVFEQGKKLYDPYTKESIGREETGRAMIEVIRVNAKQSQARVINSSIDLADGFEPRKYICRSAPRIPDDAGARNRKKTEQEERKRKLDEVW